MNADDLERYRVNSPNPLTDEKIVDAVMLIGVDGPTRIYVPVCPFCGDTHEYGVHGYIHSGPYKSVAFHPVNVHRWCQAIPYDTRRLFIDIEKLGFQVLSGQ